MKCQKLIFRAIAIFLAWSNFTVAEAQEIHLLHDITLEEDPALGSSPKAFATLDSIVLFQAQTSNFTSQLWRTNGTESGTWMVKEVPYYEGLHSYISFTPFDHNLYFTVTEPEVGQQMWVTNGTSIGTKPVFDGSQSVQLTNINSITEFNGQLYFSGRDEMAGTELWRTDGQSNRESFDLLPGTQGSAPYHLTVSGNLLYFIARLQVGGSKPRLLVTDGTDFDTLQVRTDFDEWQINNLTPSASGLFFYLSEYRGAGQELWHTDGTQAGTKRVKLMSPKGNGFSQLPSLFKVVKDKLYFYATTPQFGREIWVSDGTDTGTHVLVDVVPGPGSSYGANDVVDFNGALYLTQFLPSKGVELVKYNPVSKDFELVKDVLEFDSVNSGAAGPFLPFSGRLFFKAQNSLNNMEMWYTDGTEQGTRMLTDINPEGSGSPLLWHPIGNQFVFTANDGIRGRELWISDGTSAGTRLLKNIRTTKLSSTPRRLTPYKESLGFIAGPLPNGRIGVVEDDTIRSFYFLDTMLNGNSLVATEIIGVNDNLFFRGESDKYGAELWKTNGTLSGTELIKDIVPGSEGSFPLFLTKKGDQLFFRTDNTIISNSLLYKTNGTRDSTKIVATLWKDYGRAIITKIFTANDKVFFFAHTPDLGNELFVTDGTIEGTKLVKDICKGSCSGPQSGHIVLVNNGVIYFNASSLNSGEELWRSDGTEDGTYLVKRLYGGSGGSQPRLIGTYKNWVFFAATPNGYSYEIWKTDGTKDGTEVLPDLKPNVELQGSFLRSGPTLGVQMKDAFYFVASKSKDQGNELWRTDGSTEGTRMVKDIAPGAYSSNPNHLMVINDTLYFVAKTLEYGSELWKSDGTEENTELVGDIVPNGESSNPSDLMAIGNRLYFVASHLEHGRELFYLEDPNYEPKPKDDDEEDDEPKESEAGFRVSPVPAHQQVDVFWGAPSEPDSMPRHLMIYDILGRPVIEKVVSGGSTTVSLTGVTSGTYILRLEGVGTRKFIKL